MATVTLNRPEVKNALDHETMAGLAEELRGLRGGDARCVVLRGAGDSFCSGADVQEFVEFAGMKPPEIAGLIDDTLNDIVRALVKLRKPVVAKVDGHAVGAGCNVALACDLVVAGESAVFGELFSRIGMAVDTGGSYLLPRLVGMKQAKELVFTGRDVPAREAAEMGLINRCVPDEDLDASVEDLVRELAGGPTRALGASKALLHYGAVNDVDSALEREAWVQAAITQSGDVGEGVMAFVEGREPEFEGE